MNKQRIRLTESQLNKIIKESVKKALNEIGDTERGQYALGAAQARRDLRQQQAYQQTPSNMRPNTQNGNVANQLEKTAVNAQKQMNGGDVWNKDNIENYYKARNAYNANRQGYRNYMASQTSPSAEDYRTAKIRH